MRHALLVSYYRQEAMWPWVKAAILQQHRRPDEVWLCIDSVTEPEPDLTGLDCQVVRCPASLNKTFSIGAVQNAAIEQTDAEIIQLCEGDCIMSPAACLDYYRCLSGELSTWVYTTAEGTAQAPPDCGPAGYVLSGPRYFVRDAAALPAPGDWFGLERCTWRDPRGRRGHRHGEASEHGCNMAFLRRTWERTAWDFRGRRVNGFPPTERCHDSRWMFALRQQGVRSVAAPDTAWVIHVGPRGTLQSYYGSPDEGWRGPQ